MPDEEGSTVAPEELGESVITSDLFDSSIEEEEDGEDGEDDDFDDGIDDSAFESSQKGYEELSDGDMYDGLDE